MRKEQLASPYRHVYEIKNWLCYLATDPEETKVDSFSVLYDPAYNKFYVNINFHPLLSDEKRKLFLDTLQKAKYETVSKQDRVNLFVCLKFEDKESALEFLSQHLPDYASVERDLTNRTKKLIAHNPVISRSDKVIFAWFFMLREYTRHSKSKIKLFAYLFFDLLDTKSALFIAHQILILNIEYLDFPWADILKKLDFQPSQPIESLNKESSHLEYRLLEMMTTEEEFNSIGIITKLTLWLYTPPAFAENILKYPWKSARAFVNYYKDKSVYPSLTVSELLNALGACQFQDEATKALLKQHTGREFHTLPDQICDQVAQALQKSQRPPSLSDNQAIELMTVASKNMRRGFIAIYDGGCVRSYQESSSFLRKIFTQSPNTFLPLESQDRIRTGQSSLAQYVSKQSSAQTYPTTHISQLLTGESWVPETILGRTLIFKQLTSDKRLAIKCQKSQEPATELAREFWTLRYMNNHKARLDLKSQLPEPKTVGNIKKGELEQYLKIFQNAGFDIQNFKSMVFDQSGQVKDEIAVFHYETENNYYFNYLHNKHISPDDFSRICHDCIHDLLQLLLKEGIIFHQLVDLFHNAEETHLERSDQGRYEIIALLLATPGSVLGRLTAWKKSTKYPNLGKSGLRDLGDFTVLPSQEELENNIVNKTHPLYPLIQKFRDHSGSFYSILIANAISEYLFVLQLLTGRWASEIATETAQDVWAFSANLLSSLCQYTINVTVPFQQNKQLSLPNFFKGKDINTLVRQMKFWMTPEHAPYVKKGQLPPDVYPKTSVIINPNNFRKGTFNDKIGFSIHPEDGPDLGPVNGPYPILNFVSLLTITIALIKTLNGMFGLKEAEKLKEVTTKDTLFQSQEDTATRSTSTSTAMGVSDPFANVVFTFPPAS